MYTKMDALGFVWSATWFSLSFGHIFENDVHGGTIPKPLPSNKSKGCHRGPWWVGDVAQAGFLSAFNLYPRCYFFYRVHDRE